VERLPFLQLTDICRHYTTGDVVVKALDGINLDIHEGEFVAIMGQSGSGKSTLMNILGCLDRPTRGEYLINGKAISTLNPDELALLRSHSFGFIFQRYNLLATSNALENVEMPAIYAGIHAAERARRAKALLSTLGMSERQFHKPAELSGGQQQRVAIARALMNNPPLILADEPSGALDSKSGEELMALLIDLHQSGRTIILITHDQTIASHAQRQVVLVDGKIIEDSGYQPPAKNEAEKHEAKPLEPHTHMTASLTESLKTAIRALRDNKFRTALTLLGIVIGVAAVITMLAVGQGSKQSVLDRISTLGTNILSIRPGIAGFRGSGDIVTLTQADALDIQDIPNVSGVLPERDGRVTLRIGNTDDATTVQGVGSEMPFVRDWPIQDGTFFNDNDIKKMAPVMVIGQTVYHTLFPDGESPIDKYVLVGNIPFQIIGLLSAKGAAPWGQDQDDAVFIPVTTAIYRLLGKNYLNSITVKIDNTDLTNETQEAIRQLLIKNHGTEDFRIRNTASLLETATQTQNTLTVLLGAVAAISLLVGGIGVMNIMLVSVTERTREIGIRMATGARRRDIMFQFNTEAAMVCILGGIIGVLLGFLVGWVLSLFGVKIIFTLMPAVIAFSFAVLTGLIFGYLPARKAAYLDPVDALSSE
jgi:macrolide transport system ATP-binding/permease protein